MDGISEEGFRSLFNNLPVACFGYDRRGRIQIWNRAYEDLYGFSAREIVNHSLLKNARYSKDRQRRRETIKAVFSGRSFYSLEWRERRADGSPCFVQTNTYPLRDVRGKVVMGIGISMDVTAQKRSKKALKQAARRS